jgi:hypothetical protein
MRPAIVDEFDPPFTITEPSAQTIPFVFNVPHAGPSIRRPSCPRPGSMPSP